MKKISVKNIIAFRRKSDKSRKTFLKSLDKVKAIDSESGGNYWVRSLSALSSTFKSNDNQHIKDKIEAVSDDFAKSKRKQTKDMYQRNLDILFNYENFDFSTWYPNKTFKILEKANKKSVIEINKVPVQVLPSQVFTFTKNKIDYVGAIWFVAKLDGYSKAEFGAFAESLFIYLENNFSKKYQVSYENCLVVDVLNLAEVNYQMILDRTIPAILGDTLNSIRENL
ncbi:hypothetical protein [Taibaiella chishuiensis]|uniref:Uncharacterized protein n=1 Tax=Taibaiella chishuiensis TaxID=1434707 RepID=A0A2P8CXQ3_9BACT|nr:hypothetical protein [Taibaiella chishuiensis]PSK89739.1 hypothetical protein B0I18_11038 [Taibaiella chishuiensis]